MIRATQSTMDQLITIYLCKQSCLEVGFRLHTTGIDCNYLACNNFVCKMDSRNIVSGCNFPYLCYIMTFYLFIVYYFVTQL